MAGVTVDTIAVSSEFSPEGFQAGIAASLAEFQQFTQRLSTLSAPVLVELKLTGVTQALAQAEEVRAALASVSTTGTGTITPPSSAGFQAFGDAALASFERIEGSLTQLNSSIQTLSGGFNGFFQRVIVGASQQAAAVEQSATRTKAAFTAVGAAAAINPAGLRGIQRDIDLLNQRIDKGRVSAEDYAAAISDLRARYAALRAAAQPVTVAVDGLNTSMERSSVAAREPARANLTLRSSLVVLAAQATGTSSTLARLAEGMILFGSGTTAVIAGFGAILVAATIFEAVTKSIQAARKATDDFIKSANETARSADAVGQVREAFAGIDEPGGRKIEGLTARLVRLNEELRKTQEGVPAGRFGPTPVDEGRIDNTIQKLKDLRTAALQAGLAFLDPILSAQRSASNQATQDDLALQQQGIQAREAALKSSFDRELTNRDQFFKQRQALADRAERADVAALQAELARAEIARAHANVGASPAEKANLQAQVDHLQAQVTLREGLLRLQGQQIANEEELARLTLLERAGLGNAGGVSGVQPPAFLQAEVRLKPKLDLSEVNASIQAFAESTRQAGLDNEFERARLVGLELLPVLAEINLKLKDIGNANIVTPDILTLNQEIHQITRGLGDIAGAARNVGLIGDEAANAIGSVLDLGDAIGNVIEKASAGNILGLIGAGIGLIGAVAGPNESEIQRTRVLEENNRRLTELAVALHDTQSLGALASQRQTLLDLGPLRALIVNAQASGVPIDAQGRGRNAADIARQELQRVLDAAGIDIRAFAAQIKAATGIDILDEKGRVVARAFDQAREAIDKMVEAATHFSNSISEQRSILETEDVFGVGGRSRDESVANLERIRQIQLDNLHLKDAEEARVRSIDLSTAAGREAFKQWEITLLERAKAGQLTAEELQGFANVDALLPLINDAGNGLNALADSANRLNDSFNDFNLPTGFRREFLAFETALPGGPTLPVGTPPRIDHFAPPLPGDLTTDTRSSTVINVTFESGSLVQATGESTAAFADRVVEAIRFKANGQSGDTTNFSLN